MTHENSHKHMPKNAFVCLNLCVNKILSVDFHGLPWPTKIFEHENFTHEKIQHENFPNYGTSYYGMWSDAKCSQTIKSPLLFYGKNYFQSCANVSQSQESQC